MDDRKFLILYGSQTGTAQDIAERIWRESKRLNLIGPVKCMDDYQIENLIHEYIVVFVVSTTGQGEEPDNMKKFWKFLLRKSLPSNSLQKMKFAVLGLGDSSYVKFNFAAKRLARRLSNLGGTPLISTGLADDQHDLGADGVVEPWIQKLWAAVGQIFSFSVDSLQTNYIPSARWNVEKVNEIDSEIEQKYSNNKDETKYSQKNPCKLSILSNIRTTNESHFQDVRFIELEKPSNMSYQPGDVLMLMAQNTQEKVDKFFEILNENRKPEQTLLASDIVKVTIKDKDMPIPEVLETPIRLSECAKKYWDLNFVPRRYVFTILSHLTTSDLEREKLQEFSKAEGQEDLYNYCNRPKRNILEVMSDFPSATQNITLEFLFEILQPIRPRAFSIASSPTLHIDRIHILLAIIQYKTTLVEKRFGLCSTFLASLNENSDVYGWIKKGSFKFPPPDTPVVMVGPGTGVAPFRSYINEMVALEKASDKNLILFFGCRHRDADYHFGHEWENLKNENKLSLFCAFSRENENKVYVQNLILEQGELVWDVLKTKAAFIFLAGSSKNMPQSVRESFVKVIQNHGQLSEEEAESFISDMEKSGRYQSETWG